MEKNIYWWRTIKLKSDDRILVTSDGGRRASGKTAAACLVWHFREEIPTMVAAFGRVANHGTSVDMEFEGAALGVQLCMMWLRAVQ
jgi:hypothetical protein